MPIILSLTNVEQTLYAAGPEGLFYLEAGELQAIPQPQSELACCAAVGKRLYVGGAPHGVAFTLADASWQAGWMDGISDAVYCIAPDPQVEQSGVLLAGSAGGGVLRSHNRGQTWSVCNFGLQEYNVLALAWAPPSPTNVWPAWEVVFAGSEAGLYRSPNGGRGWKRSQNVEGIIQAIAIDSAFHDSGLVLAGSENNGLWRSLDGGYRFERVREAPERVNALCRNPSGWLLSDPDGLWHSNDAFAWRPVPNAWPALTFWVDNGQVWVGGENGVTKVGVLE
jgi:hypothetical protein